MAIWYSRQSSAEIVNGQVIEASDFNNEYAAIVTAFASLTHATTGHNHTGSTGQGPLLDITGSLGTVPFTGVLGPQFGGIKLSASDPTATDDTPDYVVGSKWINTTSDALFVCVDNTSTAAIWQRVSNGSITGATTIPTVNEDSADGYTVGSIIVNTTQDVAYICVDATAGAAVWYPISSGKTFVSTSNPGVNDDVNDGYTIGSVGVNTSTNNVFIASSVSAGAAVWQNVTFDEGQAALAAGVFN
jgi:hypothetical protein